MWVESSSNMAYLIVVGEVVVRNCYGSWTHNSVNEAISTIRERIVINPNVAWSKDGDAIAIRHCPPPIMAGRASNHGIASRLAVMNVESMNNDICNELDRNASPISDVDIRATAINCLEAVHNEFLLQSDDHVPFEYNPQRPILNDRMA